MPVSAAKKEVSGNVKTGEIGETGKTNENSKNGKNRDKNENLGTNLA